MASCPEASWKRTLMSFGQRHEVFWFSDFATKSCAIHQVARFGAFSPEGMKNNHLVSSFSTLDLQSGIRKCYRMQPFHSAQHQSPAVGWVAPSLTRQRLAGCFVATLHRPRLQGSKAKICLKKNEKQPKRPSCHCPTQPIFQPTTGPLIVAAQRIIWDCSAEACYEITRGWRAPFVFKKKRATFWLLIFGIFRYLAVSLVLLLQSYYE